MIHTVRKSFIRKPPSNGNMSLQITSMADIFMIILVFLLKTYGNGLIDVSPSKGMSLPRAIPSTAAVDGLKLEIGEKAIRVDGKAVAQVAGFEFAQTDLADTGASKTLTHALLESAKAKPGNRMIIVADQRAPYVAIKTVMASAALSGYSDFKLAVVNPN